MCIGCKQLSTQTKNLLITLVLGVFELGYVGLVALRFACLFATTAEVAANEEQ